MANTPTIDALLSLAENSGDIVTGLGPALKEAFRKIDTAVIERTERRQTRRDDPVINRHQRKIAVAIRKALNADNDASREYFEQIVRGHMRALERFGIVIPADSLPPALGIEADA